MPPPSRASTRPAPNDRLRESTWWWARAAAVTVTVFVAYQLLLIVRGWMLALLAVVLFVVIGAIIALIAEPGVRALERHARLPRPLAILAVLVGGLAAIAGFVYLVSGPLVAEAIQLARTLPGLLHRAQHLFEQIQPLLRSRGIPLSPGALAGSGVTDLLRGVGDLFLKGVLGTVTLVVDTVIVLVVAFWLLRDGREIKAGADRWLPAPVRRSVGFGVDAVIVVVGGYVRGQLFMALLIGVLAGVGTGLIGVPFPFVVAVAAGVLELIPMVGPFAGAAVALLLALTKNFFPLGLETIAVFLVIHLIEGYVVGPRIQARFVRVHPLVAFLALLAGIEGAGLIGALLALPAVSLLAVFVRATVGDWKAERPDLFTAQTEARRQARRRRILGEFRMFNLPPGDLVRDPRRIVSALRRPAPAGDGEPERSGKGKPPVSG